MAITIYHVAERAKVSIGTASRVLNGGTKGLRRDARERAKRIIFAASELGYQANRAAKAVATGQTGHIGYIIADTIQGGIVNQFFGQFLSGAEKACSKNGYLLNVAVHNLNDINSFISPQAVSGKSVDGIILAGESISSQVIAKFDEIKIPCVCLSDHILSSEHVVGLSFNLETSSYFKAIEYAAQCGHRKIGITLSQDKRYLFEKIRKIMKVNALTKLCQLIFIKVKRPDFTSADMVFENFKATDPTLRPEIILTSEQCALGMMRSVSRSELICPDDISILSLQDSFSLNLLTPSISSVKIDLEKIGKEAVNMLIEHVQKKVPLRSIIVQNTPVIIERESVKQKAKLNKIKCHN